MAVRTRDTASMDRCSGALRQAFDREMEELFWIAEAIVGDPHAAACCVEDAIVRADCSAYVTPNWRDRWIKRCVVREAIERKGAEIKRIAATYGRDAIRSRACRNLDALDKRALRCLTAIKISKVLSIFERSALILHEYLGFSSHDCALLLDSHRSVIDSACSDAACLLLGKQTSLSEKAARIRLPEVTA